MKTPKLLNTTAMRMAIRYSLIYAVILVGIIIVFNLVMQTPVDDEIKIALINKRDVAHINYEKNGLEGLADFIKQQEKQSKTYIYLLIDKTKNKLAGNLSKLPDEYEGADEVSFILYSEQILPITLFEDEAYLPTISTTLDNGGELLIAHPSPRASTLKEIYEYLLEFAIPLILLSLLIGISLAYAVYRRINTISRTAIEIMQGDITQRIPLSQKNDEFDGLSMQLNTMMDRIEKLIRSIREVSDNVAHDLRSPLTRLRNNFEITLLEERSSEEYHQTLNQGVQDVETLLKTFNALLSIAQAESGNHRSQWKQVNLNKLLIVVVEFYEPLAEEKKQTLSFKQQQDTFILASSDLLAQAFSNLIENAIKYTPESGTIKISLECNTDFVTISFTDSGSGFPADEYEHVLERFVRLDNSRNTQGNGLGLSLVNAVSELHHGTLHFNDANPGLIVTMRLPLNIK